MLFCLLAQGPGPERQHSCPWQASDSSPLVGLMKTWYELKEKYISPLLPKYGVEGNRFDIVRFTPRIRLLVLTRNRTDHLRIGTRHGSKDDQ